MAIYLYLLVQAILLPPNNYDSMSYNLARVLLMIKENSLFLSNFSIYHQANLVLGYDILSFLFLRNYSDFCLGIFNYLCYITIIVGTYSLVNKYYQSERLGIYIALIISCFTELILQSTSTKNDIPTAAIAVSCFLAIYNILREGDNTSLLILILFLLFGISVKNYFLAFGFPLIVLLTVYLIIHQWDDITKIIKYHKSNICLYLMIVFISFTLIAFFGNNLMKYGKIFGHIKFLEAHQQKDGFKGASANGMRYLIQSVEFPKFAFSDMIQKMQNNILKDHYNIGAYDYLKKLELTSDWVPNEDSSWFGPLALLLVIPSIIYSIFKGEGLVRLIGINLLSFYLLACYFIPWCPWNNRFFDIFYAGSGLCIAFLLKNFHPNFLKLLLVISMIVGIYATFFNINKPFFNIEGVKYNVGKIIYDKFYKSNMLAEKLMKYKIIIEKGHNKKSLPIFNWLYYVKNRNAFVDEYYKSGIWSKINKSLESNQPVLLLCTNDWILSFLLKRPDLNIVVASPDKVVIRNKKYDLTNGENLGIIKANFKYLILIGIPPFYYLNNLIPEINYKGEGLFDRTIYLYKLY
jgi:hypothetical protein